jgi:hypothetical protein
MTSDWREWDFDELHRRRPHVEILPPEPKPEAHVRVTIHRRNTTPPWVMVALIFVALFVLWRFKFGLLPLAVILGASIENIADVIVLAIVAFTIIAWRERRAGRPF